MSASTPETNTTERAKTRDERYHFRGYWSEGGVCRVRVYQAPGLIPVAVCSELEENTNTSITNLAEVLAAEIIALFLPDRFEAEEPVIWVEHYPGRSDPRRNTKGRAEFDRVTFASWTPRVRRMGGVDRRTLGEPDWHPLPRSQVASLIGEAEVDA
jgi:hypothetical protein